MIRSIIRYLKYIFYSIFFSESRNIVLADLLRFNFGQKVISNTTINPWTNKSYSEEERNAALENAVQWLLHSQRSMIDDGFGSYHLINKWSGSYVETSGYIIPSLLEYGRWKNDNVITDKAILSADWLMRVQKKNGAFQGGCIDENKPEVVFNTGQVIRGLQSAYKYTNDQKYLNAAIKACDWLCEIQEHDGYWKKNAFMSVPRVYDSYVDAPLLMIHGITGKEIYKEKAIKNLNWIVEKKQLINGWFEDCDNTVKRNERPILHTIAYTIDGLLECGIILNDKKFIDAAIKSADSLFEVFNKRKFLKGRYDSNWFGSENLIPTGCAQIAVVWMKLYKLTNNVQYLNAALKMNDILIFIQDRNIRDNSDTLGALPGSYPIWGRYEPFCYPNWATKFFVDSLLLENRCLEYAK